MQPDFVPSLRSVETLVSFAIQPPRVSVCMERGSLKWIPVQALATFQTNESEPVYPFQMVPSEMDRL
jgi:hypothetical protein